MLSSEAFICPSSRQSSGDRAMGKLWAQWATTSPHLGPASACSRKAPPQNLLHGPGHGLQTSPLAAHSGDERNKGHEWALRGVIWKLKIHTQRRISTFLAICQFCLDEKCFWQKLLFPRHENPFYTVGKEKNTQNTGAYMLYMLRPRGETKSPTWTKKPQCPVDVR